MEKDFKEEIRRKMKVSIAEILKEIEIETYALLEYFKIAEDCINNRDFTMETNLLMMGFAVETNRIIPTIKNEKSRIELDEQAKKIWDKWYEKTQKFREREIYI